MEFISKEVKRTGKRHISLRPRTKEAGKRGCTTLMQGITLIGAQRFMKNHRKELHDFATHIPKKSTEGTRTHVSM
jgi:hypothetical protein